MDPVEVEVKATVNGANPEVLSQVKTETGAGGAVTVIDWLTKLVPPGPVTVSTILKVPALLKVCDGLTRVDVPPSPKSHE